MTEKHRILVVEDDALVSEIIGAALAERYSTSVVETAAQALEKLRNGGFRLMLLDCTLPGGVDDRLIPEADRLGTTVILMSGDPARMAQLSHQPRRFLGKPFTLDGLLGAVEAALAATSSHAA